MKKKKVISLLGLTAVLALTGCGSVKETPAAPEQTQLTEVREVELAPIKEKVPEPEAEEEKEPEPVQETKKEPVINVNMEYIDTTHKRQQAADVNTALFDLGKDMILSSDSTDNKLISPISIERCFTMAIEGAEGRTKEQMVSAIYEGIDLEEAENAISETINNISRNDKENGGFKTVNSAWINTDENNMQIKDSYRKAIKEKFGAESEALSFENGGETKINKWTSDHTDGMIPQIVSGLTRDDEMVLVNATLFESEWVKKFSDNTGAELIFKNADGEEVQASPLCSGEDIYLKIGDNEGFKKRYRDGFYYIGILPNEGQTPEEVLTELKYEQIKEGLSNIEKLNDNLKLDLTVPKYSYDYNRELTNSLKGIGITDAFNGNVSNFKGMSDDILEISKVLHKTHIEFAKDGTKAAAATAILVGDTGCAVDMRTPEIKELKFDRPFAYLIMSDEGDMPLFMGIVNNLERDGAAQAVKSPDEQEETPNTDRHDDI